MMKRMNKSEMQFDPKEDGVTHINIYSQGDTELGKMLSHFWRGSFRHPFYGKFESMEGFWYYIKARADTPEEEERRQQLRRLAGWEAKKVGRTFENVHVDHFQEVIMSGNLSKIRQTPRIQELMMESHLPFDHYYLMGKNRYPVRPAGYEWLIAGFEEIRDRVQAGTIGLNP